MSISVLLADDHTILREGLRHILESQRDIRVIAEAVNGLDAVKKACRLHPDVVVMDIAMPELNGISAARQIIKKKLKTKILMLSVYSTSEHIFQALQAGATGYVLKDSAGREVIEAVRAVRAGQRFFSSKITDIMIEGSVKNKKIHHEKSPISLLSDREKEIMQLVAEGKSSAQIARALFLSPKTIETYRCRLMQKLAIKDMPGLIKFAIQHGLTPLA